MALLLAHSMVDRGTYDPVEVRERYVFWLESHPFDCGTTIAGALRGHLNLQSQANGALMRISPIGVAGARLPPDLVAQWAEKDAELTHPNPICRQVNALFVMAIAAAIREALAPEDLYQRITSYAQERQADSAVLNAIHAAADGPPGNFMSQMGWVLIAFQNALYQLLHAPNLEDGVIDSVMRGAGRMRDNGRGIEWGPGRHGPGQNVFCYFLGPKNMPIEYTGEMQQIDDSYRVGQPDDWKWPPGRLDHWGITAKPSERMEVAGQNYLFTADGWRLDEWR